ncbi:MAG: MTH1187 family thiamine-binding protein [Spirochaetes bacterium]|nr:MTH1187 family thiamine-binding protein [Spirochaetota bacterium]
MSAIAEISLFPLDKGMHLSRYVSSAVEVLRESGLPHQTGPMGTCVEGEWDQVLQVIDRCVRRLKSESDRVYCVIKLDITGGKEPRMERKVQAVT